MNSPVLFQVIETAATTKVGIATLNTPQTLNGLSLEMCELLATQLGDWQADESIAMVILKGAGDRAFCAGGDLHGLYRSMQENVGRLAWDNVYARHFFDTEYRLDYQIHTYSKPVLCWGSGIVMGGGVGLMMGASHRVVTETTRFAMPEITIGLYPDVGGSWMLARLPGGTGLFLALTGAQVGHSDCRYLGLADYTLDSGQWDELVRQIQAASWSVADSENHVLLERLLRGMQSAAGAEPGPLEKNHALIRKACDGIDFDAICSNIASFSDNADPWLKRAATTFMAGSPGSARLCFALLDRVRLHSLADVFRDEYIVSLHCGVEGDFQEGIRALLIDKDKQPRWNPATLAQATDAWVQRFFQPPWPESIGHPLADLGEERTSGKI